MNNIYVNMTSVKKKKSITNIFYVKLACPSKQVLLKQ